MFVRQVLQAMTIMQRGKWPPGMWIGNSLIAFKLARLAAWASCSSKGNDQHKEETLLTPKRAADNARISKHQRKQAVASPTSRR